MTDLEKIRRKWVGKEWSVWWNSKTHNRATILGVYPYTGRFQESFVCVFRLTCAESVRGWTEMCISHIDLKYPRPL